VKQGVNLGTHSFPRLLLLFASRRFNLQNDFNDVTFSQILKMT